jgi:hypothetical protein
MARRRVQGYQAIFETLRAGDLVVHLHARWERRKIAAGKGALLKRFESLGDNCEFGLVQEQLQANTLGLLRASGVPIEGLIAALDARFAACVVPENLDVWCYKAPDAPPRLEYVVTTRDYGINSHAGVHGADADYDAIRRTELKKMTLLRRKLIEDLEDGEKIFVYKSKETAERAKVDELVAAMRRYGPSTLLWVTLAEPDRPPGTVEWLAEGLLRGYIDRFAPYESAHEASLTVWSCLCSRAYALWLRERRKRRIA